MRLLLLSSLVLLASAAATLVPTASAACDPPDFTLTTGIVNAYVYDGSCIGVQTVQPNAACIVSPIERGPIHVYVLAGGGCRTGVIVG